MGRARRAAGGGFLRLSQHFRLYGKILVVVGTLPAPSQKTKAPFGPSGPAGKRYAARCAPPWYERNAYPRLPNTELRHDRHPKANRAQKGGEKKKNQTITVPMKQRLFRKLGTHTHTRTVCSAPASAHTKEV